MRALSALLRRELGALFTTPLAFAVATAFLLVEGLLFFTALTALSSPDAPHGAALEIFFGGNFYFWIAQLLFVPLLTMRLFAGERQAGTLEGLLTAPVSAASVVLAKFLATFIYYVALWLPTLLYVAFLALYGGVDPGAVAAGYLGLVVVGAALVAVGLLASVLSPSPIVAGAAAFAALLLLVGLGLLEPHFADAATLLDHLSLPAAMADFGRGVVDTRRVVFPLSVCAVCLFVAARALEWRRLR